MKGRYGLFVVFGNVPHPFSLPTVVLASATGKIMRLTDALDRVAVSLLATHCWKVPATEKASRKKKQANLDAVRVKADQLRLVLANKYAALEQGLEHNIEVMNESATRLSSEAAFEVGGKAPREVGMLSHVTRDLIKKQQSM